MALKKYNSKRDFTKTSEPKGEIKEKKSDKKFVIQYHEARAKHYDFRLEFEGVLKSWAVPKGLSLNPKDKRLAIMVEDHPLDYINFEGVIPKGQYGGGTVEIWDKGTYFTEKSLKNGLKNGKIEFFLDGDRLKGFWTMIKTDDKNWLAIKNDDEFGDKTYGKNRMGKSLRLTSNPFKDAPAMLATLTQKIPTGSDWAFEIKYDGYRIISYIEKNTIKMQTRNHNDYTKKFADLSKELLQFAKSRSMVLDGEIVVFDEKGKSNFAMLQNSIKQSENSFTYVVFDILALDGEDLRYLPLSKRKIILEKLFAKSKFDTINLSSYVNGKGKESFRLAKKLGLEGIIAKRLNSTYVGKRSEDWLKIKCYKRQEFVVAGYTTTLKNKDMSALLLAYYNGDKLVYIGKVGTGFSDGDRKSIAEKFNKSIAKKSPFEHLDKSLKRENIVWLKPKFIAEIQFAELTDEQLLRQPSFMGFRSDKKPKEVKLEY